MKSIVSGKTRIKIYGGLNSIGGNCIVIESPSVKIMLDQGVNFTQLRRFYGFTIQPDSVEELREMGVLPPRTAYEGVEEIYISHLHLDHLGSLNTPNEIDVYLPSRELTEALSRAWWFGWKQHLLPKTLSFLGFKELEDNRKILCRRVSHSAFPSYAIRLDTEDTSILYTGDLRLSAPHIISADVLVNLKELSEDGIDFLIIEGTNFGRGMNYLTPEHFKALLKKLLTDYKRKLLFISVHPLDLETVLAILEILKELNYTPIFENIYHAQLLDIMLKQFDYKIEGELFLTPRTSKIRILDNFEITTLTEVRDLKKAIFIPSYAIKDIKTITSIINEDTRGLLHITVIGEPLTEEWLIEERKITNWLRLLEMTSYRLHLSGHYHPYELKEIAKVVKTKKIIPIHTTTPRAVIDLFTRLY